MTARIISISLAFAGAAAIGYGVYESHSVVVAFVRGALLLCGALAFHPVPPTKRGPP